MDTLTWQPNFYSLALIFAGILSISGAAVASQRRGNPGALWLTLLMAAIAIWSFGYALEMAVADLHFQILMAKIEYIGITTTSLLWFFFALTYSGYAELLKNSRLQWLWFLSFAFLLLAWTNELHGLIWTGFYQANLNGLRILVVTHGLAFWGLVAFSYLALLTGSILFIRQAIRGRIAHRMQSLVILLAVLVIWAGNFMYNSGLNPFPYLDLTSFAMVAAGLIAIFGLLRVGPLDFFPVVSETVLESMNDGVLVIDEQDNLLYANRVFRQYAGIPTKAEAGTPFEKIFANWPGFYETFRDAAGASTEFMIAPDPAHVTYFDLRIAPLPGRKSAPSGRIFIFHDISEGKQAEIQRAAQELNPPRPAAPEVFVPLAFTFRARDGKIVEVNRSFILNLGYARENIIGRTLLEAGLWTAEQRADFLRRMHENGQIEGYPLRLIHSSGQPVEIALTASRIEAGDEPLIFCLASAR
jgi:PAS domain S-box-containing protein